MDQPLYAIAKQIQWLKPNAFGEAKYVVIMGGLHIEMNVMKLLGDFLNFLNGSGWTSILVQSEVTSSGRADAILKGSHITRSRYAHQVTVTALHLLQVSAYLSYTKTIQPGEIELDFKSWCINKGNKFPQF